MTRKCGRNGKEMPAVGARIHLTGLHNGRQSIMQISNTKTIDSKATFSGWSGGQSQGAVAPP